jgi:N-acyl-D-amino-acid deacylase
MKRSTSYSKPKIGKLIFLRYKSWNTMKQLSITFLYIAFSMGVQAQPTFDLLIKNGWLVDGTGQPRIKMDLGIRNGKIQVMGGGLSGASATQTIDATGKIVCPGFIDVHTHIEGSIQPNPSAANFIFDGVTSVVTGNCGNSASDLPAFFQELEKLGIGLNVGTLVGHNTIRSAVMGSVNRAPSVAELVKMQELMTKAMKDGALGLSTGLIYIPGTFAKTDEIVALAKIAAEYKGIYASHIRHEDHQVFEAVEEAVTIGREAKIPVEISHLKVAGKASWGKSEALITKLYEYRSAGIDVMVDQYPYTASSTTLSTQIPDWALGGGIDSLKIRLANPKTKAKIVAEMKKILTESGSENFSFAVIANCPWDSTLNGLSIPQVVKKSKGEKYSLDDEIETVIKLCSKGPRVQMVFHKMGEEDVRRIMQFPYCMVASDAGVTSFGHSMPHPRAYGTNVRVLAEYVRVQKTMAFEEAIRKMTSLPATRFNLSDRGQLLPGKAADILIFDPNKINAPATYDHPHAYSTGMEYVFVNGIAVIEQGKPTNKKPGIIIKPKKPKTPKP